MKTKAFYGAVRIWPDGSVSYSTNKNEYTKKQQDLCWSVRKAAKQIHRKTKRKIPLNRAWKQAAAAVLKRPISSIQGNYPAFMDG